MTLPPNATSRDLLLIRLTLEWTLSPSRRCPRGRPGFEHWTLKCTKCGRIHEVQVSADPLKSEAMGWLDGDLKPPK